MLRRSKSLILAVTAVSAIAVIAAPSQAAEAADSSALGPCVVRPTGIIIADWRESVVVAGTYQAASTGGINVELTCGVVRNGVTIARVSETAPGPVAVVAGMEDVLVGTYTPCYEVRVTHIDHTTYGDTCP